MIINFISGPRNISTAVMYSFAQRSDVKVVDEPFYAYYLLETGLEHPARAETIASMEHEPERVLASLYKLQKKYPNLFLKNMAHHHLRLDWSYLVEMKNVFLIRDPKQLIASFAQVIQHPTMLDIGLKIEAELFEYVLKHGSHTPMVVDTNTILEKPKKVLRKLCDKIGIPFQESMLKWKKGGISEDGTWARYWYKNVHESTGFKKQKTSERLLPSHCKPLYEEAMSYYEKLATHLDS